MLSKSLTLHSATVTTTSNSTAVGMIGSGNEWAARITCGTVTGTNPTLDAVVQHSVDGTIWTNLIAFTQITASNAAAVKVAAASADYLVPLFPFARVAFTVGGTDTPTFTTVAVTLFRS